MNGPIVNETIKILRKKGAEINMLLEKEELMKCRYFGVEETTQR